MITHEYQQRSSSDVSGATLPRVLGPLEALCVIVGSVIGSGIFIVPARVAREVPSIALIGVLWVAGGLFSLAGALTIAELGAMIPRAGGPYVYLRAAYGRLPAFLFGWTEFLVIRAGSMATLAAAFALYWAQVIPAPAGGRAEVWEMLASSGAIAILATVNVLGTKHGGGVQVVGTALKLGALAFMIVAPFAMGRADVARLSPLWPARFDATLFRGMTAAMVGVLWAYDGWINSASLAEEIRDPERNLPRALFLGTLVLIAFYLGVTLVYHLVLTMPEVAAAATEKGSPKIVAAEFFKRLFGASGVTAIALIVMCSTFISLNGNCLSGPRAYFAMARDGLFPKALARVHARFHTPANAVVAQSAWAVALIVGGTLWVLARVPAAADLSTTAPRPKMLYDVLYAYVIFGGTVFYTLSIAAVFVLRRTMPDAPRPYRCWGYPVTPALYVVAALGLLASMLSDSTSRVESLAGLGIIGVGMLVYPFFANTRQHA